MQVDGFPRVGDPSSGYYNKSQQSKGRFPKMARKSQKLMRGAPAAPKEHKPQVLFQDRHPHPGQFLSLRDGRIAYSAPNSPDVITFDKRKQARVLPKHNKATLHSAGSMAIVSSILTPVLPTPSTNMHHALKGNLDMCLTPRVKHVSHSSFTECDCVVQGITGVHHRMSVIPLFCIKKGFLSLPQLEIPLPDAAPRYYENPSRIFVWCDVARAHALATPQPWFSSVRWPPMPHRPALASCDKPSVVRQIMALFCAGTYREATAPYLLSPDRWDSETHPLYGEPEPDSELSWLTREMPSVESVFRMFPIRHPTKAEQIVVYCMTDYNLSTPVLTPLDKFSLDTLIVQYARPFYSTGAGTIMCPICLYQRSKNSERTVALFLDREEFMQHYKSIHYSDQVIIPVSFPTQLNTRVYTATLLYHLCLGNRPQYPDVKRSPFNDYKGFPGLTFTSVLKTIVTDVPPCPTDAEVDLLGRICAEAAAAMHDEDVNMAPMSHHGTEENPASVAPPGTDI